jgi:methionyl-tRNA synthetase
MAMGLPLPRRVFGHGWLLIGDTKMSKSRGNAVDPIALTQQYGVDAVRYYLLREVPFGADGSYTEEALRLRFNVDLANDLGNLLSRSTAMIERFSQGTVPAPGIFGPDDRVLPDLAADVYQQVDRAMDRLMISDAIGQIFRLIHAANKYIEERAPWELAKNPAQRQELDNVLYNLAESLRVISVLLTPFLLEAPHKIREQLGLQFQTVSYRDAIYGGMQGGEKINRKASLFPRLDLHPENEKSGGDLLAQAGSKAEDLTMVDLEDFQKIALRVGTVRQAQPVAGADRLLMLTVFDGERERTIVSGIKEFYDPAALIGQQVVLVANLKPVKLRGIVSEGMLLAASIHGQLSLVAPSRPMPEGAKVK